MADLIDRPHIADGEFQSDKYPTTPRGKVPLSVRDPSAQGLLWEYAQRRRAIDREFSEDLETCLRAAGYDPGRPMLRDDPQHVTPSIPTALPARKEWDSERNDRGDIQEIDGYESSDYVDGWNDALEEVEAARTPNEDDRAALRQSVHQAASLELDARTTWSPERVETFAARIADRAADRAAASILGDPAPPDTREEDDAP